MNSKGGEKSVAADTTSVGQMLLEWQENSSDDEGDGEFQMVEHKSSKNKKKRRKSVCGPREKYLASPSVSANEKKDNPKISSEINLKRNAKIKKCQ